MGICAEKGVIAKWFVQTPFNTNHMINFLRVLSNATEKGTWVFMDNASYHKSIGTMRELKKLRLRWIFNKPFNPTYNPIESVFETLKTIFRNLRLKAIAQNKVIEP